MMYGNTRYRIYFVHPRDGKRSHIDMDETNYQDFMSDRKAAKLGDDVYLPGFGNITKSAYKGDNKIVPKNLGPEHDVPTLFETTPPSSDVWLNIQHGVRTQWPYSTNSPRFFRGVCMSVWNNHRSPEGKKWFDKIIKLGQQSREIDQQ